MSGWRCGVFIFIDQINRLTGKICAKCPKRVVEHNRGAKEVFKGMNMALHHASSGELIDIRPLKSNLKTAITKTLYKSNHLEVFQMVLLSGKAMPEHQVTGEITVQCIEGNIEFTAAESSRLMHPGDLLCLAGGTVHAMKALEDSSVVVTILLHGA